MTQDEIIKMAHQTSKEWLKEFPTPEETAHQVPKRFLEIFAKLVSEKEREACAVIAETPISGEQDDITMEAKDRVAKAIRARGQK